MNFSEFSRDIYTTTDSGLNTYCMTSHQMALHTQQHYSANF